MIGIFSFGKQTELRFLREVPITGAPGEPLCLLYKLFVRQFLFSLFLTRDGYVMGIITKKRRVWCIR
jgi:hypothetical protein